MHFTTCFSVNKLKALGWRQIYFYKKYCREKYYPKNPVKRKGVAFKRMDARVRNMSVQLLAQLSMERGCSILVKSKGPKPVCLSVNLVSSTELLCNFGHAV